MTTGIQPWIDATYDVQHGQEALVVHSEEAVPSIMQRSFPQSSWVGLFVDFDTSDAKWYSIPGIHYQP